ncbi:MAG: virulence RhuM family protein [Candidatus Methanoperedens sp.]|nr:virulence RhuM family protein [Candidatus Methanoperedens sp.]
MNKSDIVKQQSDFILYTGNDGKVNIDVFVQEETIWLTQNAIGKLFGKSKATISEHLKKIYTEGELEMDSTVRKFRTVQEEGSRQVERDLEYYNLDAIISVGYRVNSYQATQFRIWATRTLKEYIIKGFVLDDERLKQGNRVFGKDYFDELLERIREIRASERRFYQKITDIYATAIDYNVQSEITKTFFATVQNKLHFAIHGNTAAELIMERANSNKEHMGLTTWKNAPHGKIIKPDVSIAKNYLSEKEIKALNRITTMYLDYAEDQAEQNIPMTMEDWSKKLNVFLQFNNRELLDNPGKVTQEIAKAFAESEFEKYRIVQDQLFESDFDKMIKKLEDNSEGKL